MTIHNKYTQNHWNTLKYTNNSPKRPLKHYCPAFPRPFTQNKYKIVAINRIYHKTLYVQLPNLPKIWNFYTNPFAWFVTFCKSGRLSTGPSLSSIAPLKLISTMKHCQLQLQENHCWLRRKMHITTQEILMVHNNIILCPSTIKGHTIFS